jgi:hypothetical protein
VCGRGPGFSSMPGYRGCWRCRYDRVPLPGGVYPVWPWPSCCSGSTVRSVSCPAGQDVVFKSYCPWYLQGSNGVCDTWIMKRYEWSCTSTMLMRPTGIWHVDGYCLQWPGPIAVRRCREIRLSSIHWVGLMKGSLFILNIHRGERLPSPGQ